MTDKEFKKLSRVELVEIIYQLQQENLQLKDQNAELEQKLESKELNISEAGSIAEAALALSGVFVKAQTAADHYLTEIRRQNSEIEERSRTFEAKAQAEAQAIIHAAEAEAAGKIARAEIESQEKWNVVNEKIETLLKAHEALSAFLK